MKENIPSVEEFVQYYKKDPSFVPEDRNELIKRLVCDKMWFDRMESVSWKDIKCLTAFELARIPIVWLYDWCHVTANYALQYEVERLYKQYDLPILSKQQYIERFENKKPWP